MTIAMREPQKGSGRGFDRSYRRGAIMGLTVSEAFILLAFCLLLLFTWWQVDTERKSLIVAEKIAELSPEQKAVIVAGLSTVIRSRQKNQGTALRVSQR